MAKKPESVRVTMYDVGFGDCFLLCFVYPGNDKRHILIDCGTKRKPASHMKAVVDQLHEDCDGHVDAIVATHRHQDHISAFGLKEVGDRLEALEPEVIVQPWTEHPDAEKGALTAPTLFTRAALSHIGSLGMAQEFAQALVDKPHQMLQAASPRERTRLAKIAALSIPNKKAILRLTKMGKKHYYVHEGSKSGLEDLLPGVRVTVLGPPTLRQSQKIKRQTSWDADEFWKFQSQMGIKSIGNIRTQRGQSTLFPGAETLSVAHAPSYTKWIIKKADDIQLRSARRIVRSLDKALNNTSVILLFEIGDKVLLFPGDAQLESWQHALSKKRLRSRLKKTSLYKVGHHGSTNATPKSLWELFHDEGKMRTEMVSLLSTESGVHHNVPRKSLVSALKDETDLESSQSWRRKLHKTFEL